MTRRRTLFIYLVVIISVVVVASLVVGAVRESLPPLIDLTNITFEETYTLTGAIDGDLVVASGVVNLGADSEIVGSGAFLVETITLSGVIQGDLAVAAESVLLDGAQIAGNVVIMATTVTLNGEIAGDLSVTAENLTIGDNFQVAGDIDACADAFTDAREDAGKLMCSGDDMLEPLATLIALRAGEAVTLTPPSPLAILISGLSFSLVMAGISSLAVTLFPHQFSRIEEAIRAMPRRVGGIGSSIFLLSLGITIAQLIALAILPPLGVVLIPIYLIAGLLLLILILIGWVTLSLVFGVWLTQTLSRARSSASRRAVPPLVAVVVGSLLVSVSMTLLALLPFGGLIVIVLLLVFMSVGVGAALSTRLGTRTVRRSTFVQG